MRGGAGIDDLVPAKPLLEPVQIKAMTPSLLAPKSMKSYFFAWPHRLFELPRCVVQHPL
jgi:hypothetical protein